MPLSENARKARARLAAATAAANREPDDDRRRERLTELRREYRAAAAEDYIREVVDAAPPLTQKQRSKLAGLLVGGGS